MSGVNILARIEIFVVKCGVGDRRLYLKCLVSHHLYYSFCSKNSLHPIHHISLTLFAVGFSINAKKHLCLYRKICSDSKTPHMEHGRFCICAL